MAPVTSIDNDDDADDKDDAIIVNRPPFHDRYVSLSESRLAEVKRFFLHDEEAMNPQPPYRQLSMNIAKLWMPPRWAGVH